jgi:luciferase family oxidoreductase group 1
MTGSSLALSVLDLVPVSTDQTSTDAIAASMRTAELADRLGFTRYWFAEHHDMTAFAATTPPVMTALVASRTSRISVGAGGVMLPNHSPFVVAEQFAALEAAFPGRIDLGLGRAPGSDALVTAILRSTGPVSDPDAFPQHVGDIVALLGPDPARIETSTGARFLRTTPAATGAPPVWVLGSSLTSARLAASLGLPYAFAHHIAPHAASNALEEYRRAFQPSPQFAEPRMLMTVHLAVADTAEEAELIALPSLVSYQRLRRGLPSTAFDSIEASERLKRETSASAFDDSVVGGWVIGSADEVAPRLVDLAREYGVEELMLVPLAARHEGELPGALPSRDRMLELLATRILG